MSSPLKAEACGCIGAFAVPEGVQTATFCLSVGKGESGRTIYVDNIVLTCKRLFPPAHMEALRGRLVRLKKKF